MKDLISIIIPFYNNEKTLEFCIKSILNQTQKNYEILLINNNSTDNSKNIALSYSKKYKNIYYFEQLKKGNISLTRNIGLKNAQGNLISFVDADDIIDKNFIKIMYNNIKDNDLVICNYTTNIKKLGKSNIKNIKISYEDSFDYVLKNKNIKGYVWNKLFKRDIIINNKITFNQNLKIGEDIDFLFHYLNHCKNIYFINKNLYYYNLNNASSVNNKNNYIYALKSWVHLYNLCKSENKIKNLDSICYFYLKKYYELRYYNKKIIKNDKIIFYNKNNLNYKLKLFLYKNFTVIIIILKKLKIKLLIR